MEQKRKYKVKKQWSSVEEDVLIELWEQKIVALRGSRKNNHIFEEIVRDMGRHGFIFSAEEIRVKIHNLTAKYR